MTYALESHQETQRLEKQSTMHGYDFQEELSRVGDLSGKTICDAGCGSGIVSRYLAQKYPTAEVKAFDASDTRVQQSKALSSQFRNLSFQVQNILDLHIPNNSVDFLFSRFVLEHLDKEKQMKAVSEFHRCLKPGGQICLIDIDGAYFNIFPRTPIVQRGLKKLRLEKSIDLFIGRKLPHLLSRNEFTDIDWRVEAISFTQESLAQERELIAERFETGASFFTKIIGSSQEFHDFKKAYLDLLSQPGTSLCYTKWIVTGKKRRVALRGL